MKIAWISYEFLEYSALHINALNSEHDVLAVLPSPHDEEEEYRLDPDVQRFLFTKPRLRQVLKQNRSVQSIRRAIDEFQPDVIHFQQAHLWFNFSLKKLAREYPLVVTIHDPRHHSGDLASWKTPQWIVDHGFRQANHVIVHGDQLVETVQDLFGFEKEHVHAIPHVVMGNLSDTSSTVERDPNLILFFGRIWDYKGLRYLIEAEPLITREFPDAKILIAGEGDDFQKYRDMMVNPSAFQIHNEWISDQQRCEFFERAAMVVLPYTDATQSGVVPVAYNFRKPVVATQVGALSDCVLDGETGILVPPQEPKKLAEAIIHLLRDPVLAQDMGDAAYQWIQSHASPEVVAAQHVDVYEKAIQDRKLPSQSSLVSHSA